MFCRVWNVVNPVLPVAHGYSSFDFLAQFFRSAGVWRSWNPLEKRNTAILLF